MTDNIHAGQKTNLRDLNREQGGIEKGANISLGAEDSKDRIEVASAKIKPEDKKIINDVWDDRSEEVDKQLSTRVFGAESEQEGEHTASGNKSMQGELLKRKRKRKRDADRAGVDIDDLPKLGYERKLAKETAGTKSGENFNQSFTQQVKRFKIDNGNDFSR